ncbi:MAG: DUF4332 domain-containing protein [Myxococcales bacterium]|nr:DUF4332 domain-containing protein [Myxococcales bacterium]MCB9732420.1 DUF4332 domain-containing protein [Deltaproteobacteria bacterium]
MPHAVAHRSQSPPSPPRRLTARGRWAVALPVALALVAILVAFAAPGAARASHYRFERIELLSKPEQKALARVGIHDTRALLARVQTLADRVWLSRATGLALERLTSLATQCDLLRLDGVGPTMMAAFQKAGVAESDALAHADPADLLSRLQAATAGTPMRSRLPDTGILATWIRAARRAPSGLRDIPTEPIPAP